MEPTSFPVQAPWHPFNFRSRKLHLVSRLNSSDFNFYLLDLFIPLSAALYHPTIHLSDIFFCVWVYESRLSFFLCKPACLPEVTPGRACSPGCGLPWLSSCGLFSFPHPPCSMDPIPEHLIPEVVSCMLHGDVATCLLLFDAPLLVQHCLGKSCWGGYS